MGDLKQLRPSAMMLPQLGTLGGVPAPRKYRIASIIIAEAAEKVHFLRVG